MSRQKISRLFAPCAAQSLRRFLISLSEEISPFVPFPAAGCGTNFPPPLAENPLVLWQTFFTAFAAAGDRLNLPNSRKSEVTYGLVPLMELAAHCSARPIGLPPNGNPDWSSAGESEFRPRQGFASGKTLERRTCGEGRDRLISATLLHGRSRWTGIPSGIRCASRRCPIGLPPNGNPD